MGRTEGRMGPFKRQAPPGSGSVQRWNTLGSPVAQCLSVGPANGCYFAVALLDISFSRGLGKGNKTGETNLQVFSKTRAKFSSDLLPSAKLTWRSTSNPLPDEHGCMGHIGIAAWAASGRSYEGGLQSEPEGMGSRPALMRCQMSICAWRAGWWAGMFSTRS